MSIELYNKKIVVFNKKTKEIEYHYTSLEEGMKMIKQGLFAFHVQDTMAYKVITDTFTEMEICDLTEINLIPQYKMVMIVRKVSPFRKILAYSVRRITEHGIMARERTFWRAPKPKCVRKIHKEDIQVICQTFNYYFRNSFMCAIYFHIYIYTYIINFFFAHTHTQVRVEFIYSVLIFLTAGYVISFGILLVEVVYVKYCNNNHRATNSKRGTVTDKIHTHTSRLNT